MHTSKHVSALELIKHGVSQGSDLGLLLLLFYINDLSQSVKGIAYSHTDTLNSDPEKVDQDVKVVFEIIKKGFNSIRPISYSFFLILVI
jgi:hypothetical protein